MHHGAGEHAVLCMKRGERCRCELAQGRRNEREGAGRYKVRDNGKVGHGRWGGTLRITHSLPLSQKASHSGLDMPGPCSSTHMLSLNAQPLWRGLQALVPAPHTGQTQAGGWARV